MADDYGRLMSVEQCKPEGSNGTMHLYIRIVLYLYLYLYPFSPVAAPKAKQPMHGMAVVAAAWSRLPRAATSPGAVAVGMQKQGQRQRHRQGQGQGRGQEEGQGQKSTGALQGWVEASETTPGAGADASYLVDILSGSMQQQFFLDPHHAHSKRHLAKVK